jgi:hypothetical protein
LTFGYRKLGDSELEGFVSMPPAILAPIARLRQTKYNAKYWLPVFPLPSRKTSFDP